MDKLIWAKVNEDAIIPTKREEDAGYDLYPCFKEDFIRLKPDETKMIPLGVATAFPSNYVMILKERGSTGTKGIGQRCGVIDSGYRGEYVAPITNHSDKPLVICKKEHIDLFKDEKNVVVYPYEKAICQGILLELPNLVSVEMTYDQLKEIKSERMMGKLGSSGK